MSTTITGTPRVHALHVIESRVLCHATRRERDAAGEQATLTAEHVTCPICVAKLADEARGQAKRKPEERADGILAAYMGDARLVDPPSPF